MCHHCDMTGRGLWSRRRLLGGLGALALAAGATPAVAAPNQPAEPGDALRRLLAGNARYVANKPRQRDYSAGRVARAASQAPFASIVGCADSRVAPELAFDQGPGDLFVTRVAGNFVNQDALASLEFGAEVLGSGLILVLGHTGCGAVAATIDAVENGTVLPGHLPALVEAIRPAVLAARKEKPGDMLAAATAANIRLTVEKLKTAGPILSRRVAEGRLTVAGGVYDLATGKVTLI